MKKCSKCKLEKEVDQFCKNSRYKDGRHDICKQCRKEYNINNKEKIKEYGNQWRNNNPNYGIQWKVNNPDKYKTSYTTNNSKKTREQIKSDNILSQPYKAKWAKDKYKNDLKYRLSQILRIRLLDALKGKSNKIISSLDLLGCNITEFKQHLELQFKPEMNWENHGKIWEIDHIIPCSSFDLINVEEQQKCFHYTNIQPLFKTSDLAKSLGYINEIGNRNKSNKK